MNTNITTSHWVQPYGSPGKLSENQFSFPTTLTYPHFKNYNNNNNIFALQYWKLNIGVYIGIFNITLGNEWC